MLLKLLAMPLVGPIRGTAWVIEQVARAAEQELGDAPVRREIDAAREAYERGEIDEDDLAARTDALLDALLAGRTVVAD